MFIKKLSDIVDMSPYLRWIQNNAKVAYNNRNIYGLVHSSFNISTTNDESLNAVGKTGGTFLALNLLYTAKVIVFKDTFSRIETEDFNYKNGGFIKETKDSDGNKDISSLKDGCYI